MTLTVEQLAVAKGFAPEEITRFGVRQGSAGVEIPYLDAESKEQPRVRLRNAIVANDGSKWSRCGDALVPYGLNEPVKIDDLVFIVEGEYDSWALWTEDLPALGVPGATNTRCLRASHLGSAQKAYVIREPGEAGSRFLHLVAHALYDSNFTGTVYSVAMPNGRKDPQEAFAADRAGFKETMRIAVRNAVAVPRPQPSPNTSSGIAFRSWANVIEHEEQPREEIIEGLLIAGGVCLLSAAPKVGKTVLGSNAAYSVATGSPFLGRRCKQGVVMYLSMEESESDVRHRFEALGLPREAGLHLFCGRLPHDAMESLERAVLELKPSLLVIDTFQRLTRVTNINDYSEVTKASEPLLALARTHGAAQVWIHHNKKGEASGADRVTGSPALVGSADTILLMSRMKEMGRDIRTVSSVQRFGQDMAETTVTMDPDTFAVTSGDTKFAVERRECEQAILGALNKPMTRAQVLAACGRRRQPATGALNSLVSGGFVLVSGKGSKSSPYFYSSSRPLYIAERAEPQDTGSRQNTGSRRSGIIGIDDAELRERAEPLPIGREPLGNLGNDQEFKERAERAEPQSARPQSGLCVNGHLGLVNGDRVCTQCLDSGAHPRPPKFIAEKSAQNGGAA